MQTSPLRDAVNHDRLFRACVLNAVPIPAQTLAVLEARGVNVSELETRILQNIGFKR